MNERWTDDARTGPSSADVAQRPYDSVDVRELASALLAGKWIVLGVTLVVTAIAIAYAVLQPNVYESEIVLAPAATEDADGIAGLAGQLGGLASLAGINLGGAGSDRTALALEVMESRAFINDFVSRHGLLPYFMAAKSWSLESGEWTFDSALYDASNSRWVRKVSPPKTAQPSAQEIAKEFRRSVLSITQDDETGMVRVKMASLSPIAAKEWVSWFIADLNHEMRKMDIQDAEKSIGYLNEQIVKTSVSEMQNVFYGLIEQQTRTMMLAQVREDYIFKIVDPAVVPVEKSRPMRPLICALGLIVGFLTGAMIVLVRHFSRSRRA